MDWTQKNKYAKEWRARHPVQAALIDRRKALKKYGLTEELYNKLFEVQKGVCAICGNPQRPVNKFRSKLSVDQDHETGAVRGLLCCDCNIMLGHAKENQSTLLFAINYLRNSPGVILEYK